MQKSPTQKQINRRRSMRRRARTSVKAECRRGTLGFGPNLAIDVLDLADTGIRILVREALEELAEVEIIMTSYGIRQPLKRAGLVRWVVKLENGSYCIGVEFQKPITFRDWQNLASPS